MSATSRLPSPPAHMRVARLTTDQCEKLHAASLTILERTGVRLFEPEAVDLVRKAGARVSDGNRVFLPPRLVEQALSTAPHRVDLYDRHGRLALPIEGQRAFFGPGSDCLHIVDHRTNQRRPAVLDDVRAGITVCDALENIDFVMSMFLPGDVHPAVADRYQMEVILNRTTKPIVFVTYDLGGCVDAVEMAEAVAGGPAALRQKPLVAGYINVTTGLLHNAEALQKLLYLADKGLPALYIPVVSGGTTAPISIAGSLALTNAGTLAGLVVAQLKREGTPVIVSGFGGDALDMRTLVDPYCGPDGRGTVESLAHYYDLPMFGLGGASDSKVVDQQAAAEATAMLMVAAFSGGNLIHDLGYLESGLTGSLAQLAICDEVASWIRASLRDVEVTDESLALDLIEATGPDGDYLASTHTLEHFRERWYPRLIDRQNHDGWREAGGTTMAERAAARVDEILAEHQPEPLPAKVAEAVHNIVLRAADALAK